MTLYSQRDNRWRNQKFGKNGTIGSLGCTLTCISMLLDLAPDQVAKRLDEVKAFTGNFLIWTRLKAAYPQLQFIKRVRTYDNADVKANIPCLVEVDFDGTPRKDDRHWVLFVGNKRAYDPWLGKEISTSHYTPLLGYSIVKVS